MIDPGVVAIAAVAVTLLLGLLTPAMNLRDSRARARRERAQRRAESYVDLLRIVERRGLVVQDQAFNYTETEDSDYPVKLRRRPIDVPPRGDRTEARALAAAYGTPAIRHELGKWIAAVEAWEAKVVSWEWDFDANGPSVLEPKDAEPERTSERQSRDRLGAAVSAALDADL